MQSDIVWAPLKPKGSEVHLLAYTLAYCKENDRDTVRVGIDPLFWVKHSAAVPGGDNAALRLILLRCNRMLRLPITPLFVFPGPKSASEKQIDKKLRDDVHSLLDAFGFQYHEAPGSASAELVRLELADTIDAIMTDDFDVVLHGGRHIIRNPSSTHPQHKQPEKQDKFFVYKDLSPTLRAETFLLALACGYCCDRGFRQSVVGMQAADAMADIAFFIFNDMSELASQLLRSTETTKNPPPSFISSWRKDLQELLKQHFNRDIPLPPDTVFPNTASLTMYTNVVPPTSSQTSLVWRRTDQPSIYLIAAFVGEHFSWTLLRLQGYISNTLLPSSTSRILQQASNTMSPPFLRGVPHDLEERLRKELEGSLVLSACSSRLVAIAGSELLEYRMEVNASTFKTLLEHGYNQGRQLRTETAPNATSEDEEDEDMDKADDVDVTERENADGDGQDLSGTTERTSKLPEHHMLVWIPADIAEKGCPAVLLAYLRTSQGRGQKRKRKVKTGTAGKGKGKEKQKDEETEEGPKKPAGTPEKKKRKKQSDGTKKASPSKQKETPPKKSKGKDQVLTSFFTPSPTKTRKSSQSEAGPSNTQ